MSNPTLHHQPLIKRSLRLTIASAVLAATLAAAPSASGLAHDRFSPLDRAQLSAEQTAISEAILSGPRHSMAGPFDAWLRSPVLAGRLVKVGDYLRFESSLPRRASELAIMITSQFWNTPFAWAYHYPLALQAGVTPAVLTQLATGATPTGMTEDESLVYAVSTELHRDKALTDATYAAARARFGKQGIVDLIALNGYYDIVCMTLNVAKMPAPSGYVGVGLAVRVTN